MCAVCHQFELNQSFGLLNNKVNFAKDIKISECVEQSLLVVHAINVKLMKCEIDFGLRISDVAFNFPRKILEKTTALL